MHLTKKKGLAAIIGLLCSTTALAAPLDLDTSFSTDGFHEQNYGMPSGLVASFFSDVAVTPSDKIIAVGHAKHSDSQYEGIVVKYTSSGIRDNSFATNGIKKLTLDNDVRLTAIAIQADGKILIAGHTRANSISSFNDWTLKVLRLNTDGSLDSDFANAGVFSTRLSSMGSSAQDIAITSDGSILVSARQYVGRTLNLHKHAGHIIKLDSHGNLDPSFGFYGTQQNNGNSKIAYSGTNNYSTEFTKLTLDDNDNIYVGGTWLYAGSTPPRSMLLGKIRNDGSYVQGPNQFSHYLNRWAMHNDVRYYSNTQTQVLNSTLVLPSGDIVGAGCNSAVANSLRVQKQNASGAFVTSFASSGIYTASLNNTNDCITDLNFHPNIGLLSVGNSDKPFISSINEDTGNHIATTELSMGGRFNAVATLNNGKVVAVGHARPLGGDYKSLIAVFQGSPLVTGSTPNINSLTFAASPNVALNTLRSSTTRTAVVTPTGSLSANIINGEIVINSNTPESRDVTITDGDNVKLQHTSSMAPATDVVTKMVVDRGTGFSHNNKSWKPSDRISTFKSTTLAADTTPNAFNLSPTGLTTPPLPNTISTSPTVTVAGINTSAPVSIATGEYSIQRANSANPEAYTSANGTIEAGDRIHVRHTNGTFGVTTTTTLTIGGVSANFISITAARDITPNGFSAGPNIINAALNQYKQSNQYITVTGINDAVPISIVNGEYSIDSAPFTSASGTVNNNQRVRTRQLTPNTHSTVTTTTITIGGISDSYTVETIAGDTTPNGFSFNAKTNVALNSSIISDSITVGGISTATPISISNGEYSINGGSFNSVAGSVVNGDTIEVRHTSSGQHNTSTTSLLTIGGVSANFQSTTLSISQPTPPAEPPVEQPSNPPSNPPTNTGEAPDSGSSSSSGGALNIFYLLAAAGLLFRRKRNQ